MDANSSTAPPVHRGHVAEIVNIGIHHWPVAITTVLLLLAGLSLQNYLKPDSTVDLPRVGDPDLDKRWTHFLGPGSWEMYKEGYNKVRDCFYSISFGLSLHFCRAIGARGTILGHELG